MASFRVTILFYVIIFCRNVSGIININSEKKEKIDNFVNSLFECDRYKTVAGMSLAVVHNGEILYTTGYGVKNLGKKEKYQKHFIQEIINY